MHSDLQKNCESNTLTRWKAKVALGTREDSRGVRRSALEGCDTSVRKILTAPMLQTYLCPFLAPQAAPVSQSDVLRRSVARACGEIMVAGGKAHCLVLPVAK